MITIHQLTDNRNTATLMQQILEVRFTDSELMGALCQELLEVAESTGDLYSRAFANLYLLDYYHTLGEYDSCRFYLMRTQLMCQENGYSDLLLTMHNIAGMYFQDIFDEQSALQHYLEGLELAKAQNAPTMESKLLNNIGICFSRRDDAATAATYFRAAFETMEPHLAQITPSDMGNTVSFLCNLAEAYQKLGKCRKSKLAILRAESLGVKTKLWELWICYAWCGHYAICGDSVHSTDYAVKLLEDGLAEFDNAYFKVSTALEVCGCMLRIGNRELALRYLELLETCCGPDNLGDYYNSQVLRTRYYETFGTEEERRQAYLKFYEVSSRVDETDNAMRVQAQLAKIELTKARLAHQTVRRENRELEDASHMDELTWLYNRRYMTKLLSKVASQRDTATIGYIMLDVDYFKQYNDYYGHFKGDDALRCVGKLLQKHAYHNVYPSRYGGDEFMVMCVNLSSSQMEDYIKHIQTDLEARNLPHERSQCSTRLTLSIGYSNGAVHGCLPELLLDQADKALYEAKRQGRDRFVAAQEK